MRAPVRRAAVLAAAIAATLAAAPGAHAQATRTWVSGVGDDVNPCSRTAPCKTFAGAISKTADPGAIDALDPGGFGAVTITKSTVIDGTGTLASILASGTNGVVVNAPGKDVVLRGIDIDGAGLTLGTNAVNVVAARSVTLENVSIARFSNAGVQINAAAPVKVLLNGVTMNQVPAGVLVPVTGTGAASIQVKDTTIGGATDGVRVQGPGSSTVLLDGVSIADPASRGIAVLPTAGGAPTVRMRDTTITGANPAVQIDAGGYAGLLGSFVANNTLGLLHNDTGQIEDLGGNNLSGNATDGTFTITPPPAPVTTVTTTVTTPAPPPVTNTITVTKVVCAVPSVTGLTLTKAKSALSLGHCTTGKVTQKTTSVRSRIGRVIAQSVKPGTQTKESTAVALQVGRKAQSRRR